MPRGGKRPGAGRKLGGKNKPRIQLKTRVDIAARVLDEIDAVSMWKRLLQDKQSRIRLLALQYLTDRAYGRPVQMIQGDLLNPVSINLEWRGPNPQSAEPVNVTPVSNLLAIPIEAIVSDSNENKND